MDTLHRLNVRLQVTPVWGTERPVCHIWIAGRRVHKGALSETTIFEFDEMLPPGQYSVAVEFLNKKNTDTIGENDKAIVVDKVIFNNIENQKFIWEATYTPRYPEPWLSEQRAAGIEHVATIPGKNYIGWNGKWELSFTTPIFTWIHKVEDHGWIFD